MNPKRELEAVVEAACGGATVLTGNTRATRFLLARCDARLKDKALAWKTPDILPFSTWVQRTFRESQVSGASDLVLLNTRQSNSLWQQCIGESTAMPDLLRPASATRQAADAWALVHSYRIALNAAFESTAQSKTFRSWARRYQQILERRNWTDTARVADELAKTLKKIRHLLPKDIHIWGYAERTPQSNELLAALREAGVPVTEHPMEDPGWTHARKLACDDASDELRKAAAWARHTLGNDPSKRIGVVVPRLREQRAAAESTFMEVLHPEFYAGHEGARAFDISLGESQASYPLVRTALALLQFSVGEIKFQEVKELIGSPFIAGAAAERHDRARLCRWLGKYGPEQTSAAYLLTLMNPERHEEQAAKALERIQVPRLRRMLSQIARPDGLPKEAMMSEWATLLGRRLGKLGWPAEEDQKLDSRNFQAYKKWLELLTELASLDVTQGPVDHSRAVDEIKRAAAGQIFAPENTDAPVQVMDEDEAEGSLFDQLWICGLDDETWPPRRSVNPFVPIKLQQNAKVRGCSPAAQVEEATDKMTRLLAAAPDVMLSHPLRDAKRYLRESPGIAGARKVTWAELGIPEAATWMERLRGAALEEFQDERAPAMVDADLLHRGTSLLRLQSECPFHAFAELRLSAEKLEEPRVGIDPRIRGNLIERVLQLFWEGARDLANLRGLPAAERKRLIANAVDQTIGEMPDGAQTAGEKKLREIERERLVELTNEWLQIEEARSPFHQVRHQQEFDHTVAGMRLSGRIDRIDRSMTQLGEVVIDYKASSNQKNRSTSWETPRPALPQLPLYAVHLQSQGKTVVGVAFGSIATGKCEVNGMAEGEEVFGKAMRPRWTTLSLGEQIEEWAREIEKLVKAHAEGDAKVDPKNPPSRSSSTCKFCHLQSLCRVAECVMVEDDEEEPDDE